MDLVLLAFVVLVAIGLGIEYRRDRAWDRSWVEWCLRQSAPGWPLRFRVIGRTR